MFLVTAFSRLEIRGPCALAHRWKASDLSAAAWPDTPAKPFRHEAAACTYPVSPPQINLLELDVLSPAELNLKLGPYHGTDQRDQG